jgi:Helix-turn-helix domain
VRFDPYFIDILMPDLVGHDRSPAAFIVYLYLWRRISLTSRGCVQVSYATIALECGLSKTSAQRAVIHLRKRGLLSAKSASATSVPEYRVLRPWVGRLPAGAA